MKKYVIYAIIIVLVIAGVVAGIIANMNNTNENEGEELTKVKVNEVARSVFYAPQYAAITNGYFEENGIEVPCKKLRVNYLYDIGFLINQVMEGNHERNIQEFVCV